VYLIWKWYRFCCSLVLAYDYPIFDDKHRESYSRVSPKLINYIKMIINQAPVTAYKTSERDYIEWWHVNEIAFSARFVCCKTLSYFANCERRGCDIIEHSQICVSMDERCPGKISCICGEPAIPPVRRQRTEARRIPRVRECSPDRLIDNVSEGTFYRVLSRQDISRLCRMRFQPQVLWQIWNRCWQVYDGES